MMSNIESAHGLIFSQPLLIYLVKKGMTREDAYKIVQIEAMKSWSNKRHLKEYIRENDKIKEVMSEQEIEECFNVNNFLKHVDTIFKRMD